MDTQNLIKKILLIYLVFFPSLSFPFLPFYESYEYNTVERTEKFEPKGFVAETLVKTPHGYTPIAKLNIGDEVVCFDNQSKCTTSKITKVHVLSEPRLAVLQVGTETLLCHPMQKFCCVDAQQKLEWAPAHDLSGSVLSCKNGFEPIKCSSVYLDKVEGKEDQTFKCGTIYFDTAVIGSGKKSFKCVDGLYGNTVIGNQIFYDLEIENYHNFCVTKNDIIVHNVAAEIILTYIIGEGFQWSLGILATFLGISWLSGRGGHSEIFSEHQQEPGFNSHFNADEFGQRFNQHSNANEQQNQGSNSNENRNNGGNNQGGGNGNNNGGGGNGGGPGGPGGSNGNGPNDDDKFDPKKANGLAGIFEKGDDNLEDASLYEDILKPKRPNQDNSWIPTKGNFDKTMRHDKFGKFYHDENANTWWSKDRAQHGNSAWKIFKEKGNGLEWHADADNAGNIIVNKHKGPVGRFIPWKEFHH